MVSVFYNILSLAGINARILFKEHRQQESSEENPAAAGRGAEGRIHGGERSGSCGSWHKVGSRGVHWHCSHNSIQLRFGGSRFDSIRFSNALRCKSLPCIQILLKARHFFITSYEATQAVRHSTTFYCLLCHSWFESNKIGYMKKKSQLLVTKT